MPTPTHCTKGPFLFPEALVPQPRDAPRLPWSPIRRRAPLRTTRTATSSLLPPRRHPYLACPPAPWRVLRICAFCIPDEFAGGPARICGTRAKIPLPGSTLDSRLWTFFVTAFSLTPTIYYAILSWGEYRWNAPDQSEHRRPKSRLTLFDSAHPRPPTLTPVASTLVTLPLKYTFYST